MAILIISTLAFGIGLFMAIKPFRNNDNIMGIGYVYMAISGIVLAVGLLSLPFNHYETKVEIQEFIAVRESIMVARGDGDGIENAAIQHKIIDQNAWLARKQYKNKSILGLWVPDIVGELEPIR